MAPKEGLSTNYTVYHSHFQRTACGLSVFSLQLKTSRPIFLTQMHTLMRAVQNQYKQAGSYKVNKQLSGKIVQRPDFSILKLYIYFFSVRFPFFLLFVFAIVVFFFFTFVSLAEGLYLAKLNPYLKLREVSSKCFTATSLSLLPTG